MLQMFLIMILLEEIQNKNFIYINIFIMPYKIKKIGNYYQVKNKDTGQIKAKRTTKIKAIKQIKFLKMIDSKRK